MDRSPVTVISYSLIELVIMSQLFGSFSRRGRNAFMLKRLNELLVLGFILSRSKKKLPRDDAAGRGQTNTANYQKRKLIKMKRISQLPFNS